MSVRTGTSKRGAKATQFPFSRTQDRLIIQWCKYLKDNITTIAGNIYIKKNKKLTGWKVDKSKELMELDEFEDVDTSDKNTEAWRKAIVTRFTNYYHTHIRPIHIAGASAPATEPTKSTPNKLLRSFALLSTDLSGREYFTQENEKVLLERTDDIHEARGHAIPKGAARNIALSQLWDEFTTEEKNQWKERAEMHAMDVPSNRQEFPLTIGAALQNLCKRGRLGTVIMSVNVAYRSDDNGLDSHCINIGFNAETGKKIAHNMDTVPEWSDMWRAHAESVLPEVLQKLPSVISLRHDGVPIFPTLDLGASSPAYVASIVEEYITKLWDKASPADHGRSNVLWNDINNDTTFFYDTDTFTLPAKLSPALQCTNLPDLYKLVDYFYELQRNGTPFKFTRRNELSSDSDSEDGIILPPVRRSPFKKKRTQILSDDEYSGSEEDDNPTNSANMLRNSPVKKLHAQVISALEDQHSSNEEEADVVPVFESPVLPPVNPLTSSDTTDATGPDADITLPPSNPSDNTKPSTPEDLPSVDPRRPLAVDSAEPVVPASSAALAKRPRGRPSKSKITATFAESSVVQTSKRTLRSRGPTGAVAVLAPGISLKRSADSAADGEAPKKKRGWKGWALVEVTDDTAV